MARVLAVLLVIAFIVAAIYSIWYAYKRMTARWRLEEHPTPDGRGIRVMAVKFGEKPVAMETQYNDTIIAQAVVGDDFDSQIYQLRAQGKLWCRAANQKG